MKTLLTPLAFLALTLTASAADYPVAALRVQKPVGRNVMMPTDNQPTRIEPGTEIFRSDTGETLVKPEAGKACGLPSVSLDGKRIYYPLVSQIETLGKSGESEIWVYDLETKANTKILSEPGVAFLGPQELPGGWLAYTSNKRNPRLHTGMHPSQQQGWLAKVDGTEQRRVGQLHLGCGIDPVLDPDPETKQVNLLISQLEVNAQRYQQQWAIWSVRPDYSQWSPVFSGFTRAEGYHGHCAARDAEGKFWRASILYYHTSNEGFGRLDIASRPPEPTFTHDTNPSLFGNWRWQRLFAPKGRILATPWTHPSDSAAPLIGATGLRVGKVVHPAPTPDGRLLLTWSSGPVNNLSRPTPEPFIESMVVSVPLGEQTESPVVVDGKVVPPDSWEIVSAKAGWCVFGARAIATFEELYGFTPEPYAFDSHDTPSLPKGTPFGVLGGGWINKQESRPLEPTSTGAVEDPSRDVMTGAVVQGFSVPHEDSEVEWMEFYIQEMPLSFHSPESSADLFGERYFSLGMIPAKKPDGSPVTRWAVELPGDQAIGMATLDKHKRILSWSATWKKVSPGKMFDKGCVGCHVHTEDAVEPLKPSITQPLPTPTRLDGSSALASPEWHKDVKPIWIAKCAGCHEPSDGAAPSIPLAATIERRIPSFGNLHTPLSKWIVPHKARISDFYKRITAGPESAERMPKEGDSLTAEEQDTFGRWIDLGMPRGKDAATPLTDETLPTLSIAVDGGQLKVGAWDLSGVESVVATLDGEALTLAGPIDHVWTATLPKAGTLSVSVTDKANNIESRIKAFGSGPTPPDEIAELKQRIAALEAEVAKQAAKLEEFWDWLESQPKP